METIRDRLEQRISQGLDVFGPECDLIVDLAFARSVLDLVDRQQAQIRTLRDFAEFVSSCTAHAKMAQDALAEADGGR